MNNNYFKKINSESKLINLTNTQNSTIKSIPISKNQENFIASNLIKFLKSYNKEKIIISHYFNLWRKKLNSDIFIDKNENSDYYFINNINNLIIEENLDQEDKEKFELILFGGKNLQKNESYKIYIHKPNDLWKNIVENPHTILIKKFKNLNNN